MRIDPKDAARVVELTARVKRLVETLRDLDDGKGRIGAAFMRMEIRSEHRPYDGPIKEYKIDSTAIKAVVFGYIRREYQLALDECNRELRRIGAL